MSSPRFDPEKCNGIKKKKKRQLESFASLLTDKILYANLEHRGHTLE